MKPLKWNSENLWKTDFGKNKPEFDKKKKKNIHMALKINFLLNF